MSTKAPSIAVLLQKKIVELTEAWNRCKADNARLEAELREAQIRLDSAPKRWYSVEVTEAIAKERDTALSLLHDAYFALDAPRNTPTLELRERIRAAVGEQAEHSA